MKMKAFFMPLATLIAILICCNFNQVQAQDGGLSSTPTKTAVKYCDAVLPTIEKQLQANADATCTTQTTCVTCTDRASSISLAATLVVQPKKSDCGSATDIKTEADALSRGGGMADLPKFTIDIIQSPCFNGGTNLEVYSPGNDLSSREFSIMWEVDGQLIGNKLNVACAKGSTAKVRVTYLPTAQFATVSMKLNQTPTSDTMKH